MTVRARLSIIYATAMLVTLVLAGSIVWLQLRGALRTSLDGALETRAIAVQTALDNQGQAGLQEGDSNGQAGIFIQIFDASGALVDSSTNAPAGLGPPSAGPSPLDVTFGGTTFAIQVVKADGNFTVVAGSSLASVNATMDRLAASLAVVGVLGSLLSLLGGWWLAGRSLRPVAMLTMEAAMIGASDLERRLPVPSQRDELQALATTLNGMLDRVAGTVQRQRAFIASASHDLRTPIAALQAGLDLAADARATDDERRLAVIAAHVDAVRLGELATQLLDLAAAELTGRALVRATVPLEDLIDSVIRRATPMAIQRGVPILHGALAGLVHVDRVRLEQAMTNIVVNAVTHGPPGTPVEITAALAERGERAGDPGAVRELLIQISDRGPGIDPELAASVFEPFQRGPDPRTPGVGLGLATAEAAVRAHHGTIGFTSRPGGGTTFWIRIPA